MRQPTSLKDIADDKSLRSALEELEGMTGDSPTLSVAAVYVLKNQLAHIEESGLRREVLFHRSFALPGGLVYRLRRALATARDRGFVTCVREELGDFVAWTRGRDSERFRDRCDRYFWDEVVPVIEQAYGSLADAVMNTLNEAIINYAEYSFGSWALRRRVLASLFRTDDDLAYAIIRPSGSRLRVFDPLSLETRKPGLPRTRKRGWGHTLLMERALFVSFDRDPRKRGMMIVIGPDEQIQGQPD